MNEKRERVNKTGGRAQSHILLCHPRPVAYRRAARRGLLLSAVARKTSCAPMIQSPRERANERERERNALSDLQAALPHAYYI